jgi:hypothetical protein
VIISAGSKINGLVGHEHEVEFPRSAAVVTFRKWWKSIDPSAWTTAWRQAAMW